MTAPIVTLAAAVVTELNTPVATTWSQTFTAERKYRIRRQLENLAASTWYVDVVIADENSELINRSASQEDAEIDIAIHKKCNPDQLTEVDPVLNLQDEFKAYWLRRKPSAATTQACIRTEKRALWVPRHIEEDRVCTAVLRLTFRSFV